MANLGGKLTWALTRPAPLLRTTHPPLILTHPPVTFNSPSFSNGGFCACARLKTPHRFAMSGHSSVGFVSLFPASEIRFLSGYPEYSLLVPRSQTASRNAKIVSRNILAPGNNPAVSGNIENQSK
jgi:hypothetical protein